MALEALPTGSSLEIYRGQHQARIPATGLLSKSEIFPSIRQAGVFIAGDVVIGDYGVTAFILIDASPEDRWAQYSHDYPLTPCEPSWWTRDSDPTHLFNTHNGLKMVRSFVLPETVQRFFEQDRFLGEPMVQKCCLDGTIPEDFDEEPVDPEFTIAQPQDSHKLEEFETKKELADTITRLVCPDLANLEKPDSYKRIFISFHAWCDYQRVLAIGQESLYLAVANFDETLSMFDKREVLTHRGLANLLPQTDPSRLLSS